MKRGIGFCLCAAAIWMGALAGTPVAGQEQDRAGRIVDRIVEGEKQFLAKLQTLHPVLETYIQEFEGSADAAGPLLRDHYLLGRLTTANGVDVDVITMSMRFEKPAIKRKLVPLLLLQPPEPTGDRPRDSAISLGSHNKNAISLMPAGWAWMVMPDRNLFDTATYNFVYSRREFLGDVRCLVFEVSPRDKKTDGRFLGTIWVDDQDFRIARFNGIYTGSKSSRRFFHFDSWRFNAAPGVWVPAFVYVEEMDDSGKRNPRSRLKAQTRLWGYQGVRSGKLDELSDLQIESQAPVVDASGSGDLTPVEGQELWERQAEQNVIRRLEKSSLLAPTGEVDRVLNTVVNNLIATNNLDLEVQCRVLLTTPFETFSIGHTIVISRGLLDVLPDEASLAMVLAEELSHIALGHRTATKYAFGDQVMFNDSDLIQRLRLALSPQEMEAAAAKAIRILANSPYRGKLGKAGLFLKALQSRVPCLPNLVLANLGNQFASESNIRQLVELAQKGPPLEENKVDRIAALPLGSRIKLNVWTNQISLIKAGPPTLLSERETMPFEVTPAAIHLTRILVKGEGPGISSEVPLRPR
ncbi:MAG: M48 family metalloprotease [Bryobacteraceae bacterium]